MHEDVARTIIDQLNRAERRKDAELVPPSFVVEDLQAEDFRLRRHRLYELVDPVRLTLAGNHPGDGRACPKWIDRLPNDELLFHQRFATLQNRRSIVRLYRE